MSEKYNGWTNYETWRVHLEYFDGFDFGFFMTKDDARDLVDNFVDAEIDNTTLQGWISAFLFDVDWQEIADHCNESYGYVTEGEIWLTTS
jgi:hypothetical protein